MRTTPWFLRPRLRRVAAVALAVDLGSSVLFTVLAVTTATASAAASSGAASTSSVTVKWSDNRASFDPGYVDDTQLDPADKNQPLFKDLEVTVGQTQDLTDQGLQVSWKGGKPTSPSGAASNFLQIMQCWASPGSAGPTPQQCQWGTPASSIASRTGTAAATRDLLTDAEADPNQSLGPEFTHAPFGLGEQKLVPFWSVEDTKKADLGWTNDSEAQPPFGPAQSNEVTYARTALDGTGQYIVNLQSALSAPYLGCGNPALTNAGYSCWLVVVPRGEYDLNGEKAADHDDSLPLNYQYVAGSPLSASAWQDRIQVKLGFTAIGASCKLGSNEVPTAGSELVAAAFSSWQSTLCSRGTTMGYSQVGDGQARSAVGTAFPGSPGLTFMTDPVDPTTVGDATIEYAPVATSSIVVSYLIDKNYADRPDNPDKGANGTLVTDLRLTPLLVAKLLTQSYLHDIPGDGEKSQVRRENPFSLAQDPEFLALNPNFKYFYKDAAPDGLMVPFGDSDAAKQVWAWLRADSAARSFLAGEPDNWGTTINPAYLDLGLDSDTTLASFPKSDPSSYQTGDAPPPGYGTLDLRPFTGSFADGGRRTVSATAGSKVFWDTTKVPPQYAGGSPQTPGSRFELAITTSQAASLYGLPVASLVHDATATGAGVAPTVDAMNKQLARRVSTDVPGVYRVDPMKTAAGGYPLTIQAYAAVNVCASTKPMLTAYANFLDYVATAGQAPGTKLGQLPLGYAPLAGDDQAQTRSVAADLRAEVRKPHCASHQKQAPTQPGATPSASPSGAPTGPTAPTGATAPAVNQPAVSVPSGTGPVAATADAGQLGVTPVAHVTAAARYAVLAALLFALPCLIAGPTVIEVARRSR